MRHLPRHEVNPTGTDFVRVKVLDDPDPNAGGACHEYEIVVLDRSLNTADKDAEEGKSPAVELISNISFQHGPLKISGPNGVTEMALLAILLDRYRAFQKSKWACKENAHTITRLEEALMWQWKRTLDRINKGVEGTNDGYRDPLSAHRRLAIQADSVSPQSVEMPGLKNWP
jgi:hypothetical protein